MLKIDETKPKVGFIGGTREDILDDLDFATKNKFDYYEISSEGVNYSLKPKFIKQIQKIIKENNISLILHIPYFLPIASLIPEISNAALKFVKKEILLASKLGAKKITIHSSDKEVPRIKTAIEKNIKMLIKNLKEVVIFGEKYGIKIGLENSWTPERICKTAEELLSITNFVKGLGVIFDTGHANAIGLDCVKYFKKVRNRVINVHIHDNNGKYDQHNVIGEGNINFKALLKECKNSKYYGPFILEVFPHKNVLKCRERFLNIWNQI
ncbi:MAG: hypothetical protein AUK06_01475 [Parcubacteria group bacterium CG2_30_36_18]|uniref:Xylose isomerase-like TIM barrel domain-containing protein n=3 Tax=Candidatus Nealsoniibacteriota TaxID=1817911 RepID=A0A2M7MF87_9BACT|nr:MAG: hypothetical protein AUK06_01475 [Parcubacteria group bacterium CG2_30_36_18]PIP24580.1 MAG: hypothetical protein COX33_01225 [Candidatus Nealsonbacteria bacterium CG23_combo_of_CG06-09_8_20_14_all_36_125]PIR72206.1 MAG: hypothetical protein COU41_00775 [Candidatus Nealsonbacteria bacterium CG10_big_fil_rev_8_21_14_0_10_36_228]PIX88199.1 MAG: hypothetical protein COZ30_01505 [Candidatus Nealsonbacteria bacterium CG_4_10_14_3_um_filter_36_16]